MAESKLSVRKFWKPELYKIQLEAPIPNAIRCNRILAADNDNIPDFYGSEYHGKMRHQQAEQLLNNKPDGAFLIRRSPAAKDYYTLSLRFNSRTKHYKIFYKSDRGHYLQEEWKHFHSIHDLVADGLINFYMELHAAPILKEITNQQNDYCYQHSPYMTLNRRKLRVLSKELRKSLSSNKSSTMNNTTVDKHQVYSEDVVNLINPDEDKCFIDSQDDSNDGNNDDAILPSIYQKDHNFKVNTFKGLNWCEVCANFLWGFTAQGVKCEDCGIIAHARCSEIVPAKCIPDLKCIRGVFGTDLTTVAHLHKTPIPYVVQRCVEEVEARGMLQEGIYRVSGFADEIDALKLALDRDAEQTDMSEAAYGNINVIAGTLKLYLRLLPIPLITFHAYPKLMAAARVHDNDDVQIKRMHEAIKCLPPAHYNCLKYMMEHLKRVASHYAANKMNEHNLATVFAPTLIATPQHLTNLTEEIFMLSFLITNCSAIFL